jgi:hypothetical protein
MTSRWEVRGEGWLGADEGETVDLETGGYGDLSVREIE